MSNEIKRRRRGLKTKFVIKQSGKPRVVVFRSSKNIYAQIVIESDKGSKVLASASTLDKLLRPELSGNKCSKANQVGKVLAERALEANLKEVAFDRAGYKYAGRVEALAEGAREGGLVF
jgi:large subunit ribosomal protein L18